jgi:hypothetical protein
MGIKVFKTVDKFTGIIPLTPLKMERGGRTVQRKEKQGKEEWRGCEEREGG